MVFYAILETLTEFGIFSVVIPFFLAFTLSYAILEKVKILKNHKQHAIVSIVIGLLTASSMQISSLINSFLEKVGFSLAVMVCILLILGIFGIKNTSKLWWIGVLVFVAILYFQFTNETIRTLIENLVTNRYTLIFLASLLTFWWITGFPSFTLTPTAAPPSQRIASTASEVLREPRELTQTLREMERSHQGHHH